MSKGGSQQHQQSEIEIFSTKEYFDYYNSIKPHNPRLPKPTYQPPVDLDAFKKIKTQSDINLLGNLQKMDEFERKLENLTLDDPQSNQNLTFDQFNQQAKMQQ